MKHPTYKVSNEQWINGPVHIEKTHFNESREGGGRAMAGEAQKKRPNAPMMARVARSPRQWRRRFTYAVSWLPAWRGAKTHTSHVSDHCPHHLYAYTHMHIYLPPLSNERLNVQKRWHTHGGGQGVLWTRKGGYMCIDYPSMGTTSVYTILYLPRGLYHLSRTPEVGLPNQCDLPPPSSILGVQICWNFFQF